LHPQVLANLWVWDSLKENEAFVAQLQIGIISQNVHAKPKMDKLEAWKSQCKHHLEHPKTNTYPLVNVYITTYGKSQFLMGKLTINGHFQ